MKKFVNVVLASFDAYRVPPPGVFLTTSYLGHFGILSGGAGDGCCVDAFWVPLLDLLHLLPKDIYMESKG